MFSGTNILICTDIRNKEIKDKLQRNRKVESSSLTHIKLITITELVKVMLEEDLLCKVYL